MIKITFISLSTWWYTQTWIQYCRLLQGIVLGNASLTTCLHLMTSIVQLVVQASLHEDEHVKLELIVFREAILVSLAITFCWMAELSMYNEATEPINTYITKPKPVENRLKLMRNL